MATPGLALGNFHRPPCAPPCEAPAPLTPPGGGGGIEAGRRVVGRAAKGGELRVGVPAIPERDGRRRGEGVRRRVGPWSRDVEGRQVLAPDAAAEEEDLAPDPVDGGPGRATDR